MLSLLRELIPIVGRLLMRPDSLLCRFLDYGNVGILGLRSFVLLYAKMRDFSRNSSLVTAASSTES